MATKSNMPLLLGLGAGALIIGVVASKRSGGSGGRRVHNDSEMARFRQVLPEMQIKLLQLEQACQRRGFDLYWGDAFRTAEQVKATVDKGASGVKTASWHESRRAIDVYPVDPKTGIPNRAGNLEPLFRAMHQEWAALGGNGLAYSPYPNGPIYKIKTNAGPKWDGGHLEWRGGFKTALAARDAFYKASGKATV